MTIGQLVSNAVIDSGESVSCISFKMFCGAFPHGFDFTNTTVLTGPCLSVLWLKLIVKAIINYRITNKELTAGVTGQQRKLAISTPPWHLILPLNFLEVRVCSATILYFFFGLFILNTVLINTFHYSIFPVKTKNICNAYLSIFWFKFPLSADKPHLST